MARDLLRRQALAAPEARRASVTSPLTRRRAAAWLTLVPAALLLAACEALKAQRNRPHPRTDRNGSGNAGGGGNK